MATSTTLCGPCSERHKTKPSKHWCLVCDEAFCDDCQEHYKVFKATRSHELMTIDKYKSLLFFITDIQQSCTYHNEKYQHYCVAHVLPICFKCIKEHQKCNVILLDEVTNNVKTSGHFQDLQTRMMDLLQNIDRILKDRKANLAKIEESKELHLEEIQKIRNQINKHLDKLEKEIKQDLEKKECQCKKNIEKILSSVKEKENFITEYQTNLQSTIQHGSNLQTFLVLRDIEMKVFENEQFLQSLIETKEIDQVHLNVRIDPGMISISKSLKNFGSIEIKTTSSIIRVIRSKDNQAQMLVTPTKSINDLNMILHKEISTGGVNIRGCCMTVNGEYFFTDYKTRSTLNVIASDGTFKFDMYLDPSYGYDITIINEKTIAISSGYYNNYIGIDIIDTESREKIKFVNLPSRPFGITRDHDSLFVCVEGRGICKVNTVDYTTSHVISCSLSGLSDVSVFKDKIYYTDCNHSVVCCDRNGSRVWNFKDTLVLKCPMGITVDNDGHVFVVGEMSSNVVIISNDGKHHREILTKDDGLHGPSAIYFGKQTRKILVANKKEKLSFTMLLKIIEINYWIICKPLFFGCMESLNYKKNC